MLRTDTPAAVGLTPDELIEQGLIKPSHHFIYLPARRWLDDLRQDREFRQQYGRITAIEEFVFERMITNIMIDGYCSHHTDIHDEQYSAHSRKCLRKLMYLCPFLKPCNSPVPGYVTQHWTFRDDADGLSRKSSTHSPTHALWVHDGSVDCSDGSRRSLAFSWNPAVGFWQRCDIRTTATHYASWRDACASLGLPLRLDLEGFTFASRCVYRMLKSLRLRVGTTLRSLLPEGTTWNQYLSYRRMFLRVLKGSFTPRLLVKDGRRYDDGIGMPKRIRGALVAEDEDGGLHELAEIDKHATYACCLLKFYGRDDEDSRRLAADCASGEFYDRVNADSPMPYRSRDEYKPAFQKEVFFWKVPHHHSEIARPLDHAFRLRFPKIYRFLEEVIRRVGTSELAKILMRIEGEFYHEIVLPAVLAAGAKYARIIHDCVQVYAEDAEWVRDLVEELAEEYFTFKPLFKITYGGCDG